MQRRTNRATPRAGSYGPRRRGLELVVAHGFGIVETAAGSFDGRLLTLDSSGLLGTASAKQIDEVQRRYELDGDTLRYSIAMAAVDVPLTHHLRAELRRT